MLTTTYHNHFLIVLDSDEYEALKEYSNLCLSHSDEWPLFHKLKEADIRFRTGTPVTETNTEAAAFVGFCVYPVEPGQSRNGVMLVFNRNWLYNEVAISADVLSRVYGTLSTTAPPPTHSITRFMRQQHNSVVFNSSRLGATQTFLSNVYGFINHRGCPDDDTILTVFKQYAPTALWNFIGPREPSKHYITTTNTTLDILCKHSSANMFAKKLIKGKLHGFQQV